MTFQNHRRRVDSTLPPTIECYEKKRRLLSGHTISDPWRRCSIRLCSIRKSNPPSWLQLASFGVWHLCNEREGFLWRRSGASTISKFVSVVHMWLAVWCKEETSTFTVFDVLPFCNAAFYSLGSARGRHKCKFDRPRKGSLGATGVIEGIAPSSA